MVSVVVVVVVVAVAAAVAAAAAAAAAVVVVELKHEMKSLHNLTFDSTKRSLAGSRGMSALYFIA